MERRLKRDEETKLSVFDFKMILIGVSASLFGTYMNYYS